jgi:hypothetical protein
MIESRVVYNLWRLGQGLIVRPEAVKPPAPDLPPHINIAMWREAVRILISNTVPDTRNTVPDTCNGGAASNLQLVSPNMVNSQRLERQ